MSADTGLHLAQIAFASADLTRACRFYVEALGFRRAGGRLLWGPGLAAVQGLGDDAAAILWWLLGGQDFVQLEFFEHRRPLGRPRSAQWRACDLGWTRLGIGVVDLDETLGRAAQLGAPRLGPVLTDGGSRRTAIRDPDGVPVELVEDGGRAGRPTVRSVALSVADLEAARRFWIETCGLPEIEAGRALRSDPDEALWGLSGARCERFFAQGGDVLLEVVRYSDPRPAPRPADARLCDQGLLNVALATRERSLFDEVLERVLAAGYRSTVPCPPGPFASTYLVDDQGCSVEIFCAPPDHDSLLGFTPEAGFTTGLTLDP